MKDPDRYDTIATKWSLSRDRAKHAYWMIHYGASDEKIADVLGVSAERAAGIRQEVSRE